MTLALVPRRDLVVWTACCLLVASLLVAVRFTSSDGDSDLYAGLSGRLALEPVSRWVAPEWWGFWPEAEMTGLFREHPAGALIKGRSAENLRKVAAIIFDLSRHNLQRTLEFEGAKFHYFSLNYLPKAEPGPLTELSCGFKPEVPVELAAGTPLPQSCLSRCPIINVPAI